jgi:hypothetical protein
MSRGRSSAQTVEADRTGRIVGGPDLSLPGHSEAFVTGDAAAATWNHNLIVPSLAPAAKQAGRDVADVFRAVALATIGRHAAIADLGGIKINRGHLRGGFGARAYLLLDWCAGADACRSPMVLGLFDVRTRSPAYHRSRSALRKSENAGAGGRPRTLSSEASGCATSSLLSEVRLACGRPEAIMPVQLLSATTIFHETQIR